MKLRPPALFITAFLLIVISATICFKSDNTDFVSARKIIVMRNIGHEIRYSAEGDHVVPWHTEHVFSCRTSTADAVLAFQS